MSLELMIYLATVSEYLHHLTEPLLFLSIMASIVATFIDVINNLKMTTLEEDIDTAKYVKFSTITAVFISILYCVTPDSKTLYLIAGAHYGQEVLQSETATKVHRVLDLKLDEILKDLEKGK